MSKNIWTDLAAPLPSSAIEWRQDGKPTERGGKFFARFVPYVTTQYVRERLDAVVPGGWTSHIYREADAIDKDGAVTYVYKCSLSVDDPAVTREDVGEGESPKIAATDAFKRAAMRFGIAHELYSFGQNWVEVEVNGKSVKPVVDPQANYEAKKAGGQVAHPAVKAAAAPKGLTEEDKAVMRESLNVRTETPLESEPPCPKCGGRTWDNRVGKRNPKAPDFKCRDKSCDGVIWPPKNGAPVAAVAAAPVTVASITAAEEEEDDLPF